MNAELIATNLLAHWIQVAIVCAAALTTLWALRVRDPRVAAAAMEGVLVIAILLPLVQPRQTIPIDTTDVVTSVETTDSIQLATSAAETVRSRWLSPFDVDGNILLVAAIAAGILARLVWIAFGLFYVRRMFKKARAIEPPRVALEIEALLGVSARYVTHTTGAGPSAFGILVPTIALPSGFAGLPEGFQRAVICHELLHVKRRHAVVSLLEELALAALWFHPLLWAVRHRIRVAREQTVDANVLQLVGDRSGYVRCLIEMAGHDLMPHLSRAGAAMIRSRELNARVKAIFQEGNMSPVRRVVMSTALVGVVLVASWSAAIYAPLHAMAPQLSPPGKPTVSAKAVDAAEPFAPGLVLTSPKIIPEARSQAAASADAPRKQVKASYPEYPADALEKKISGTVRVNITINPAGEVSTADVVAGPPELRPSAFKAAMGLKYTPAPSTTSKTIYIEYRIDNQSWGARISDGTGTTVTAGYTRNQVSQDAGPQPIRVGGNIRPPRKMKDVPPTYPRDAQDAKVQGVVIMEVTVGPTGRIEDAKVLRSIPMLDQAAIDAVKQWEYEPVLLNGEPIAVVMTVTINFSLRNTDRLELKISPNSDAAITLMLSNGDMGKIVLGQAVYWIVPALVDIASPSSPARVSIYQGSDSGPQLLGSVDVAPGGGPVQSATTPSFGIEFVSRRGSQQP